MLTIKSQLKLSTITWSYQILFLAKHGAQAGEVVHSAAQKSP
jgi:hypothetical protein